MRVFEERGAPRAASRVEARWFTWSIETRELLRRWRQASQNLPDPPLVHLLGGKDYDYTYTLDPQLSLDATLVDGVRSLAAGFLDLHVTDELWFVSGLLSETLDGRALHRLFACLRHCMADLTCEPTTAMYAPLSTIGVEAGDFPLHADLYLPEVLFNVFEEVPCDRSGASLFLPVAVFERLLCAEAPPEVSQQLLQYLREPIREDSYECFYGLLHNPDAPWSKRLSRALRAHQIKIKLHAGEGYLIHDRLWLHGRTAPHRGVSSNRLHRLIFQPSRLPFWPGRCPS